MKEKQRKCLHRGQLKRNSQWKLHRKRTDTMEKREQCNHAAASGHTVSGSGEDSRSGKVRADHPSQSVLLLPDKDHTGSRIHLDHGVRDRVLTSFHHFPIKAPRLAGGTGGGEHHFEAARSARSGHHLQVSKGCAGCAQLLSCSCTAHLGLYE